MQSSDQLLVAAAMTALALALIAMIGAGVALRNSRKALAKYRGIGGSDRDVVDVLLDRVSAIDANNKAVERMATLLDATREDLAHSIRHLSVVRYDAFRDVGGRRSFSAALLDDHGDGLVLTTLCGRADSQTIAKGIKNGMAEGLSAEEKDAVGYAMGGTKK